MRSSGARAACGTCMLGTSERQAPGRRATVSGSQKAAAHCSAITPSSSSNTRCVGEGRYCTSTLVPSAPIAMPTMGATLFMSGPRTGCRSTSRALSALVAMPVATPCSTRAATSQATDSACQKASTETNSSASAAMMTLRRPTWSDSAPKHSSAASSAKA